MKTSVERVEQVKASQGKTTRKNKMEAPFFLHCNACYSQSAAGVNFFLTNCGHVFCARCAEKISGGKCAVCGAAPVQVVDISCAPLWFNNVGASFIAPMAHRASFILAQYAHLTKNQQRRYEDLREEVDRLEAKLARTNVESRRKDDELRHAEEEIEKKQREEAKRRLRQEEKQERRRIRKEAEDMRRVMGKAPSGRPLPTFPASPPQEEQGRQQTFRCNGDPHPGSPVRRVGRPLPIFPTSPPQEEQGRQQKFRLDRDPRHSSPVLRGRRPLPTFPASPNQEERRERKDRRQRPKPTFRTSPLQERQNRRNPGPRHGSPVRRPGRPLPTFPTSPLQDEVNLDTREHECPLPNIPASPVYTVVSE